MGGHTVFDILIDNPASISFDGSKKNIHIFSKKNRIKPIKKTKKVPNINTQTKITITKKNSSDKLGIVLDFDNIIEIVRPKSLADKSGLRVGMDILEVHINGKVYKKTKDKSKWYDQLRELFGKKKFTLIISDKIVKNVANNDSEYASDSEYDKIYKLYNWHNKVRVVTEDGKVTGIGKDDGYGCVEVKGKIYEIMHCGYDYIKKKGKLSPNKNSMNCEYLINDGKYIRGLVIHDIVYKYLKQHKLFKQFIKKFNLYDKLLEFTKNKRRDTGVVSYCLGNQDVTISYGPEIYTETEVNEFNKIRYGKKMKTKKKDWKKISKGWIKLDDSQIYVDKNDTMYLDPEKNQINKDRILKIVDTFLHI